MTLNNFTSIQTDILYNIVHFCSFPHENCYCFVTNVSKAYCFLENKRLSLSNVSTHLHTQQPTVQNDFSASSPRRHIVDLFSPT